MPNVTIDNTVYSSLCKAVALILHKEIFDLI